MQGGDISNDFQSAFLVLFEGLLGIPPKTTPAKKRFWHRGKSENSLLEGWEVNRLLVGKIFLTPFPVEVVTFLGEQYVPEIEKLLEDEHAFVRRVWATTPQELARIHLQRPDVAEIYDPDALRATLTYGRLGRHLTPQSQSRLGEI